MRNFEGNSKKGEAKDKVKGKDKIALNLRPCASLNFQPDFLKTKKAANKPLSFSVVWAGIEPATQGFSVLCSTN